MNSIAIRDDLIILNWDGQVPEGTPANAVHSPEDVVYFWPYINGYARWHKSKSAYVLNFSKQNIKRLHAQFGSIPVQTGREQITELKTQQEQLTAMVTKALKIKDLPYDRLPTYNYRVSPLGEYQHREVVFLRNVELAAVFADCGTGKTFCVLVSTDLQLQRGEIPRGKVLICGKLATLETGWLEDAKRFTDLKVNLIWLPQVKNRRERILEKLNEEADVYLINHDGVRLFKEELAAKGFEKVVIDESTILKGFRGVDPRIKGGEFAKAVLEVSKNARWKVIMSGTPAPNGPKDLWGQFYFLDPKGLFLEPSFRDFQEEYYQVIDLRSKENRFLKNRQTGEFMKNSEGKLILKPLKPTDPKTFEPKKDAIERISSIVNKAAYRVRIRDHIKDLPDLTIQRRLIDMDGEQAQHYLDMEERLKVEIDETRITVPMQLNKLMKLRQITGGFIIDNQEETHGLKVNPKMDELDSLLEEEIDREHKVVIYGEYQWEIKSIVERYKSHGIVSVYGGNSSANNLKNIKKFREDPKTRIIVLHPKSAAHGVTFTMAHYLIFYSISHSAEDNYQCIKRIERAGQKNAMFVFYLLCNKSIDRDIFNVLKLKDANQKQLIDQEQFELIQQSNLDDEILSNWRMAYEGTQ